ncbi:MAG TPA: hypothetical protein VNK96_03165 [Fimbriimonadales bacterium]|nr:hypothetical protein [Fimbriimonadales bacterium]
MSGMETTAKGINARKYLTEWLKIVTSMATADIRAIPEDKWTSTFGGRTRPANLLAADALELMYWTAETLKGNSPPPSDDDSLKVLAERIANREDAISTLESASEELVTAINEASDETLSKVVRAPWGQEAPLFMIAQIAVSHIWYHDGQFNYIHCLLGDDKIYWGG